MHGLFVTCMKEAFSLFPKSYASGEVSYPTLIQAAHVDES